MRDRFLRALVPLLFATPLTGCGALGGDLRVGWAQIDRQEHIAALASFDRAFELWNEAIRMDRSSALFLANRAQLYLELGAQPPDTVATRGILELAFGSGCVAARYGQDVGTTP